MNKKSSLSLILIIGLGIAVGAGVWYLLTMNTVTVYLFADNYPAGTKISPSILVEQQIDRKIVDLMASISGPKYVVADQISNYLGDTLQYNVLKGTPFMNTHSDKIGGSRAEIRLSPQTVGLTLPADNITGGSAELQPDSRVNIYVSDEENFSTKLLMQNMRVIDLVYYDSDQTELQGITIEVSPEQSVTLANAAQFGKLYFGIVKAGSYTNTEVKEALFR